jgi:WD40 repeat protein
MSGSKDGTARIWALGGGRCLTVLLGHSEAVLAVAFVPGSATVLTGSSDRAIKLWRPLDSPEARPALCSVIAHERGVTAIAVSLDGRVAATASMDRTAKLWQLDGDRVSLLFTLGGHRRGVTAVASRLLRKWSRPGVRIAPSNCGRSTTGAASPSSPSLARPSPRSRLSGRGFSSEWASLVAP